MHSETQIEGSEVQAMEDGFYIGMTVALIFFLLGWALANVGLNTPSNKG